MTFGDFEAHLTALSNQVEERVRRLDEADQGATRRISRSSEAEVATIQAELQPIEDATGEPSTKIWEMFSRALRRDLCSEGGMLYDQYRSWRDVARSDLVKYSAGVLAVWGLSGALLPTATVIVSALAIHIGVRAICDE